MKSLLPTTSIRCKRRYGGVEPTRLDDRSHVAGEQRDQQAADVAAVDVGVRHQHHLVVAHLVEVEGAAGAGADHLDDRGALGVGEHLADAGLLDVEDLAAQRQQRLVLAVARQLAGAEGGVALDQPQLGLADVGRAAVGELGGQRRGLERGLAPGRVLGGLRGLPGLGGGRHLVEDGAGLRLALAVVEELGLEPLGHDVGDDPARRRACRARPWSGRGTAAPAP